MAVADPAIAQAAAFFAVQQIIAGRASLMAETYRYDAAAYIHDKLRWEPWSGTAEEPGQQQVIDAYTLALRQQIEHRDYGRGELALDQLTVWQPGQIIQNRIRVPAGFNVGKTILAAGLVNHFFDCFVPSIIYTFATSWTQIHDLLWKEIKSARAGKGLPGRILDMRLDRGEKHFVTGQATDNAGGTGIERTHGQHGEYLMFVIDEAEGVPDFVYDAVNDMASGGIVIVLMLANPRTETSRFYRESLRADTRTIRISSLDHPNVRADRDIVPGGAVSRSYVDGMLDSCEIVAEHKESDYTFEVPWRPGVIFQPSSDFMWSVLGRAPSNVADNTMIPSGVYDAAVARTDGLHGHPEFARLGVDVARYGSDKGTIYSQHDGVLRRDAQLRQEDSTVYAALIRQRVADLVNHGVRSVHVRVDDGGGFGGAVIDQLKIDLEFLRDLGARGIDFKVFGVLFGGAPPNTVYADFVTQMYAEAAESLKGLRIVDPPAELRQDLCSRKYEWMNYRGRSVKKLLDKDRTKKDLKRSPDDGDGAVLALAPDHMFVARPTQVVELGGERVQIGVR